MKNQNILLEKQIKKNILPHAYLFSGADEEGKEAAIEYLLKSILGENYSKNPDLFITVGRMEEHISVEDARMIKQCASSTPLFGEKKIFLIRNIEYISREAANSLLKILEEPPQNAFILATTLNIEAVLPTLCSRFSHLRFLSSELKFSDDLKKIKAMNYSKRFAMAGEISQRSGFDEMVASAILEVSHELKKKYDEQNAYKIDELTNISLAIKDPTINKRLLAEYFMMVI